MTQSTTASTTLAALLSQAIGRRVTNAEIRVLANKNGIDLSQLSEENTNHFVERLKLIIVSGGGQKALLDGSTTTPDSKVILRGNPDTTNQSSGAENLDTIDWTIALDELGMEEESAIALIEELEMDKDRLTQSDLIALKGLAPIPAAAADLANHINSAESIQQGFVDEYLDGRREQAEILADTGNIVFAKTLLAGQIAGLEQISDLNNAIMGDYKASLNSALNKITNSGVSVPGEVTQKLGKRMMTNTTASQNSHDHRRTRMNLTNLRNK